ncbi:MAG: polysaccharide pyruvyl transferase family protein [Acidobacteriales bacterium]|nr:polysaccharide pyruvyl transferase family protein [Terriglobales bacterium]
MTLRIGFLTSLGVNVGDEFIREGIRSVLDRTGFPYHPFYVHKLDIDSLSEPREDEALVLADKYWDSDLFIQAGAPVYWHILEGRSTSLTSAWHQWMWEDRILNCARGGPVFLNLGAGTCQRWNDDGADFLADPACVEFARRASARAALTTVRDPLAARILSALSLPHELLPCPAFLAAARHDIPGSRTGAVAVNLMPLGGHYELDPEFNDAVWLMRCMALVSRLRSFGPLLFVAHDEAEEAFMAQFAGPGERVFRGGGWRDYLDVYGSCAAVVANRVHGAVCAAGFGVPAVIIGNDSRASIGDPIGIPRFRAGDEIESVLSTIESLLNEREACRLRSLREVTLSRYVELAQPILEQQCAPRVGRAHAAQSPRIRPEAALASVREMEESGARVLMKAVNLFGSQYGMRQFYNWSKVWEYPWLWLHGLGGLPWETLRLVDLGSELSPIPWLLASLGAEVALIETDPQWIPMWEGWRQQLQVDVRWHIVDSESLPLPDGWADVITSFSAIEHQPDKRAAIDEVVRVLAPGGIFALSFDICEPSMGMTFPEGNGKALTMSEFERLVWRHPAFEAGPALEWNTEDIPAFREWHLRSAPHHNYVVGAAVLQKVMAGGAVARRHREPRAAFTPRIGVQTFTSSRVKDLTAIRDALEAYWRIYHGYPKSSGGWDGLYSKWGASTPEWIPGLVPEHLPCLPRDPRNHEVPDQQYLYRSDGRDYKLISHAPWDDEIVRQRHPDMMDPARPGWAYGFWTSGAKNW